MSTPVRATDRDLRALAGIVSEDRPDLPDGEGLPPSLLADLMGQIRCDALSLVGWDSGRQTCWFSPFSVRERASGQAPSAVASKSVSEIGTVLALAARPPGCGPCAPRLPHPGPGR
jgi:hypothetical protein